MKKPMETLWTITLIPAVQRIIKGQPKSDVMAIAARTCDVRKNGALVFRDGENLSIKMIIAADQWLMVEKEA